MVGSAGIGCWGRKTVFVSPETMEESTLGGGASLCHVPATQTPSISPTLLSPGTKFQEPTRNRRSTLRQLLRICQVHQHRGSVPATFLLAACSHISGHLQVSGTSRCNNAGTLTAAVSAHITSGLVTLDPFQCSSLPFLDHTTVASNAFWSFPKFSFSLDSVRRSGDC
jgi:hypothetical protein